MNISIGLLRLSKFSMIKQLKLPFTNYGLWLTLMVLFNVSLSKITVPKPICSTKVWTKHCLSKNLNTEIRNTLLTLVVLINQSYLLYSYTFTY